MKFLRLLCLLPALVILLATCKEAGAPTDANGNPTGNVTTTLAGIVTDETGQPVSGAAVIANGKNAVTDKYGTFMIQNASVPGNRCFILCKKNGYFTGSRAEVPKSGGITELRLTLQSNRPEYSVNAASGGTLSIGSASVKFPASAFVTSSGTPFTGTVSVAAKYLDPSNASFYNSFSGDMTARRTDDTQTQLLSYGVLNVELKDPSGNKLFLAPGKTATLTYPIIPSLQKNAPASMPLWYFDETIGMWKEEGTASKTGNFYTGEVSHFTPWNVDLPVRTAIVKGQVVCNFERVPGVLVRVGQMTVLSDTGGYFSCRVPANTECIISINPQDNFGLLAADVHVGALNEGEERTVTIQLTDCPAYISGVLKDCNGGTVAGSIVISFGGNYFSHFTQGVFKIWIPSGVDFTVEAISFNGFLSQVQSIEKLNSGVKKDIGQLLACGNGNSAEFYDITLKNGVGVQPVLSPDGSMVAINGRGEEGWFVEVYDVKNEKMLCEYKRLGNAPSGKSVRAINFSDDGTKLLLAIWENEAYVVNPRNGNIIRTFRNLSHPRLLADGSAIIAHDSVIYNLSMYSVATGKKIKGFWSRNYEPGDWTLAGTRGSDQLILTKQNYSDLNSAENTVQILHWDIATDSKISNVTIPDASSFQNVYGRDIDWFSPDFSTLAIASFSTNKLNFYNTLTGEKRNATSIDYEYSRSDDTGPGVANDGTYSLQSNLKFREVYPMPITYSMQDGKIQKLLPQPPESSLYNRFTYSSNSQYIAAYEWSKVRIWKLNNILPN